MTTSKPRLLMVAAAIILCAGLFAGGAAHAGTPRSIPKTIPGGGVLTPDTTHRCGPGGYLLYVFPNGAGRCVLPEQLPPRSQADCPPGTKFTTTHDWPYCWDPNQRSMAHHAGEPPAIQCRTDADCPNGSVCYVNRFGGGQCGEPPGYQPTVP